jgi:PD-(D/E)XK nuclease superfamily protein
MKARASANDTEPERGVRAVDAIAGAWRELHRGRVGVQVAAVDLIASIGRSTMEQRGRELLKALDRQLDAHARVGTAPSLFRVMGLSRYEKPYNRVLAWLLEPAAEHGAGPPILQALAKHIGFDDLLHDLVGKEADVSVRGERPWPPEAASTGEPDLLVVSVRAALMIENKVLSGESGKRQYANYKAALKRLADARGLNARAYLLTPEASKIPDGWHGAMTHAELAEVIEEASRAPALSVWDRALCGMVAEVFRGERSTATHFRAAKLIRAEIARRGLRADVLRRLAALLPLPEARHFFGDAQ